MPHLLRVRIVLTVLVACLAAAASVWAQPDVRPAPALAADRVAIVPFGNISRGQDDDWIGAGIAETLATELQRRSTFEVIDRSVS